MRGFLILEAAEDTIGNTLREKPGEQHRGRRGARGSPRGEAPYGFAASLPSAVASSARDPMSSLR